MSEPSYPLDLLRAELKSAMSEQLVTLIDRFASKRDLADFRAQFVAHELDDAKHFGEINEKLDELLSEKDQRDGATEERKGRLGRHDFWVGVLVTSIVGLVAAVSTLATNLI